MSGMKKWGGYFLTWMCLTAMMLCMICDYAMSRTLTWSLIVLLALAAGWLVLITACKARSNVVKKSLIALSVITIPFLVGLSAVLDVPLILSMGSGIAGLSIAAVWGIYAAFAKYQKRIFLAIALSLLIVVPLACGITHITAHFMERVPLDLASDLFHIIVTLALSVTCLTIDLVSVHCANPKERKRE